MNNASWSHITQIRLYCLLSVAECSLRWDGTVLFDVLCIFQVELIRSNSNISSIAAGTIVSSSVTSKPPMKYIEFPDWVSVAVCSNLGRTNDGTLDMLFV